jgi:hypothetical protein
MRAEHIAVAIKIFFTKKASRFTGQFYFKIKQQVISVK